MPVNWLPRSALLQSAVASIEQGLWVDSFPSEWKVGLVGDRIDLRGRKDVGLWD